ncbi:ATP-dependent nuclease [Pseudomonas sp. NPDC089530]|uniref:ATP-dependent nuclease n=1 Tax=Pseudomonas sp. NPDC089530 TaxID=3390651 RepID=UPI003D05C836
MPYVINSIKPHGQAAIRLGKLTVLVGANNSGKSRTLKDLHEYIVSGDAQSAVIVGEVDDSFPDEAERRAVTRIHPMNGMYRLSMVASNLRESRQISSSLDTFESALSASKDTMGWMVKNVHETLGHSFLAYIGAEERFALSNSSSSFDNVNDPAVNALQQFDENRLKAQPELRIAFKDAFEMDIGLDWSGLQKLHLRVGAEFGDIPEGRDDLKKAMESAELLSDQGDGYRSFAGIALSVLTYGERLLLLDEPEAFLHPAQARSLGRWIAEQATCRQGQVIVATHNSDFLEGVLSVPGQADIIRLNRNELGTEFHVISAKTTSELLTSPTLSSQPVLDSLFYRGVVVCEGDPDRAIYQTVAHKILNKREVLFIHSNGKDAAKRPLELLKMAKVPVACILDFDVINSERVLTDLIVAITGEAPEERIRELRASIECSLEEPSDAEAITLIRDAVEQWMAVGYTDVRASRKALESAVKAGASKWQEIKKKGINGVPKKALTDAEELLAKLGSLGVFLVPKGELESWLCQDVAKGQVWNQRALMAIHEGGCPNELKEFVKGVIDNFLLAIKR